MDRDSVEVFLPDPDECYERPQDYCRPTRHPTHLLPGVPYTNSVIPSHTSAVSRAPVARPPNGGDADPDGRSVRARNNRPPRRQLTASPTSKPPKDEVFRSLDGTCSIGGPTLHERTRQGERNRVGSVTPPPGHLASVSSTRGMLMPSGYSVRETTASLDRSVRHPGRPRWCRRPASR